MPSAPSFLKNRKRSLARASAGPPTGFYRLTELPIRETLARKLINEGILFSVVAGSPNSRRGVRLVSAESFDAYIRSLAAAQHKRPANPKQA